MAEPRHGVIRAIFMRLSRANPSPPVSLTAVEAARISNDLYVNDVKYAFDITKGFMRTVVCYSEIQPLNEDLRQAQIDIVAQHKLKLVLRSHSSVQNNGRCNSGLHQTLDLRARLLGLSTASAQR